MIYGHLRRRARSIRSGSTRREKLSPRIGVMNEANCRARRRVCRSHRLDWRSAEADRTAHFPRRDFGDVISVDCARRQVSYAEAGRSVVLTYDGLVFALGSELVRPEIVHWRVSGRNPLRWNCIVLHSPAIEAIWHIRPSFWDLPHSATAHPLDAGPAWLPRTAPARSTISSRKCVAAS